MRAMRLRLIQPPLVQPRWRQLTLPVVGAELAPYFEVEVCDENVEPLDSSDVDLVGISCHVYNAPRAFAIARQFRARGIPVIIGGTFPTVAPDLVAPHCDSVVVGELEGQSASIAADALEGRLQPLYRAATPPSLARTVMPDFGLLRNGRYLRFNFPLETSRGCRFACRFCTANLLCPTFRTRSPNDIARDLAQHDHGQVELVDQNFLNDRGFFDEVLPILARAPIPGWFGQTTVADLVQDPSLPGRLAASRCRSLFVGLETISSSGLRSLRKAWSRPDDFQRVVRAFQKRGVLIQAGLIVGLDSDEPALFEETLAFLEQARVHAVSVSFLHFYPGTDELEALRREGRLLSDDWRLYDGDRPVIRPGGISVRELQREVRQFLEGLYGVRSMLRRALHRGMLAHPAQVINHLAVNVALRIYYREMVRSWADEAAAPRRYTSGQAQGSDLDHLLGDVASRVLERLWSIGG
jgi:radical SAM superfamily enzyme YgiQ (UPF0313 family)